MIRSSLPLAQALEFGRALRHTLVADDRPLVGKELQAFIKSSWPVYRRLSVELGLAGTL